MRRFELFKKNGFLSPIKSDYDYDDVNATGYIKSDDDDNDDDDNDNDDDHDH